MADGPQTASCRHGTGRDGQTGSYRHGVGWDGQTAPYRHGVGRGIRQPYRWTDIQVYNTLTQRYIFSETARRCPTDTDRQRLRRFVCPYVCLFTGTEPYLSCCRRWLGTQSRRRRCSSCQSLVAHYSTAATHEMNESVTGSGREN